MDQVTTVTPAEQSGHLLFAVWAAEVLQAFWTWWPLAVAGQVALCLYLLVALRRAAPRLLIICAVLLSAAGLMLWRWGHVEGLAQGLQSSLHYAAFFAALQFLRGLSQRIAEVRYTRMAVSRSGPAAAKVLFLLAGHWIGAVFAAGALFLLASMASPHASEQARIANARSAVLGLGTAIAWSPLFVAMAIVAALTPDAEIWQLIALGLPPAAFLIVARCLAIGWRQPVNLRQIWCSLLPVQKLILPLVATVAILTAVTGLSNLTVVALLVPCVALLAAWARRDVDLPAIARRTGIGLSRLKEEVLLVSVALVIGQVAVASPELVSLFSADAIPALPRFLYLLLAAGVIFAGGFVGLHPLLTTSLSLPIVHSMAAGACPPVLLSAAALIGWAASAIVSVWAVPVLVAGHAFRVPVRSLSYGPNLAYAAGYLLAGVAFLEILARMGVFVRP